MNVTRACAAGIVAMGLVGGLLREFDFSTNCYALVCAILLLEGRHA